MWFWSTGDEDPKRKTLLGRSGSYQAQNFSLHIVPFALVQTVDKKNRGWSTLQQFAWLDDEGA
jgi:hypothetical protein